MRDMMEIFETEERKVQNIKIGKAERNCETCIKSDVCRLIRISELVRHRIRDTVQDTFEELSCDQMDLDNFSFEIRVECKRWISK